MKNIFSDQTTNIFILTQKQQEDFFPQQEAGEEGGRENWGENLGEKFWGENFEGISVGGRVRRLVLKCVWSLPGGCHDENNNLDENVLIMMTMTIVMVTS